MLPLHLLVVRVLQLLPWDQLLDRDAKSSPSSVPAPPPGIGLEMLEEVPKDMDRRHSHQTHDEMN